jgi:hypothetical protein
MIGNAPGLAGLHQGQGLHQLVQGTEAAGHDHVGAGELHEHDLAGEEMTEGLADVLEGVGALLVGKLDVQADAGGLAEEGPLVGRLHDPRPAAGDHREPGVRQLAGDGLGEHVIGRVGLDAGAAEDAHRRADGRQPLGGLHELGHDLEHAPGLPGGEPRLVAAAGVEKIG